MRCYGQNFWLKKRKDAKVTFCDKSIYKTILPLYWSYIGVIKVVCFESTHSQKKDCHMTFYKINKCLGHNTQTRGRKYTTHLPD